MMQLHQEYGKFVEMNTTIVVVGPDPAKTFKAYWEENNLEFYGIPDESHHVLKLYGQQIKLFKLGRMPAQMLIDTKGLVRFIHYGHSMQDIPDNMEIFRLIDSLKSY